MVPLDQPTALDRNLILKHDAVLATHRHAATRRWRGHTPLTFAGGHTIARAELNNVRWVSHCHLVQLPEAA